MSARGRRKRTRRGRRVSPYWWFGLPGLLSTVGVTLALGLRLEWPWVVAYLLAVGVTTFLLYAVDKLAARRGWLRVPEATLHLFTLAGGTPFALVAQRLLRHKTIKGRFRVMFWVVVALQVLAVGAWIFYRSRSSG